MSGPGGILKKEEKNMRTLKKSLSLILALVFVLGLCTVGSNAAFADIYSDAADVTADYLDAIEVLTGLQIINGYKDGTFGPGTNVTRAEAAAMIARMMLGREAADKLPVGEVKFSDVPETHWAVQYIAFCANKGIIVGMGNGTFCPNDPVTGTQLAAMLLRALGYDAMGEYQGKGWDINAVADALYYGVFDDSKVVDFSQPATREETALYIWNTLWINLVGYDVDLNFYDMKERISDGEKIGITFADDAFDLKEYSYDSRTNPGTYVVLGNQATGEKYTIVGTYGIIGYHQQTVFDLTTFKYVPVYDADGNPVLVADYGWTPQLYLDYETPLDYIGHEVTVYIDKDKLDDTDEHIKYYKTYMVKDESTVLTKGSTLDDFYRNLKAENKSNVDVKFADVRTLRNYDYKQTGFVGNLTDGDDDHEYKAVYEVKGQKSSNDYAPSGTWILDHANEVLLVLKTDYRVAKVKEVDTDHDEVVLDIHNNNDFYVDGPFDMKWNDIDLVTYDGIAKGDYVQVVPVGKLFYINQTTTKTQDITTINTKYLSFNNWFGYDLNGYGIPIPDQDDYTDVGIGDKVKFYVIEGIGMFGSDNYFGLQIIEKAKTEGIVYIVATGDFLEYGEWDTDEDEDELTDKAKIATTKKVQGINQEGEEVVYKFTEKQWNKLVEAGTAPEAGSIYEVRKQGNSYFFDDSERALKDVVKLTNDGKSKYLTNDFDVYYITDDSKVIYWTGTGADLEIEVASSLAKGNYDVWALTKKSGGSYKLNSVWVDNNKAQVEIPDDYPTTGYIYVADEYNAYAEFDRNTYKYIGAWRGGTIYSGYDTVNDQGEAKYTVYEDGKEKDVYVTGEDIYTDDGALKWNFYLFKDDNKDGVLELKKVEKRVLYGVKIGTYNAYKLGKTDASVFEDEFYGMGSEAGSLKGVTFVDVSGGTTSGTRTDANVIELATLQEMLSEGYQFVVDYMYTVDGEGDNIPVGVVYVTEVYTPENERGTTYEPKTDPHNLLG